MLLNIFWFLLHRIFVSSLIGAIYPCLALLRPFLVVLSLPVSLT
jgi:hypothetical protein